MRPKFRLWIHTYHHGYKDKAKLAAVLAEKSLYITDYIPQAEDPFVFLITCSYWKKGGRFVVVCGKYLLDEA